jgi:hypothetical protein
MTQRDRSREEAEELAPRKAALVDCQIQSGWKDLAADWYRT